MAMAVIVVLAETELLLFPLASAAVTLIVKVPLAAKTWFASVPAGPETVCVALPSPH